MDPPFQYPTDGTYTELYRHFQRYIAELNEVNPEITVSKEWRTLVLGSLLSVTVDIVHKINFLDELQQLSVEF
jgi:hypothetical protein